MTDHVLVKFAGERSGTCALSWGQCAIWRAIGRLVPDEAVLNMSWITALEDEGISYQTPLDRITDTVRFMLERHESLRTLVRLSSSGEAYQELVGDGVLR